jgi:hypothetical protein
MELLTSHVTPSLAFFSTLLLDLNAQESKFQHLTPTVRATKNNRCWGPSESEGPQKQDLTVFL